MFTRELKKGSAEFLILSLLEHEPRHGYDLCRLIESRSNGVLRAREKITPHFDRRSIPAGCVARHSHIPDMLAPRALPAGRLGRSKREVIFSRALSLHAASLYPMLYRMELRRWIAGRWVEKAGLRRRRYYRVTPAGKKVLAAQRDSWREFVRAIGQVAGVEYA